MFKRRSRADEGVAGVPPSADELREMDARVDTLAEELGLEGSVLWAARSTEMVAPLISPADGEAGKAAEKFVLAPSKGTRKAMRKAADRSEKRGPGFMTVQAAEMRALAAEEIDETALENVMDAKQIQELKRVTRMGVWMTAAGVVRLASAYLANASKVEEVMEIANSEASAEGEGERSETEKDLSEEDLSDEDLSEEEVPNWAAKSGEERQRWAEALQPFLDLGEKLKGELGR